MSYKFQSNSNKFTINFEIQGIVKGYFPQIGLSAREGICVLYRPLKEKQWYNIDNTYLNNLTVMMTHFMDNGEYYEILICGPIISHLSKLQVEIPDNFDASIVDTLPNKNMLVAGGSNSFGIGCTTTAFMFSNIIERKFDVNMYHITYHDINYLKLIYDFYKNSTPPVVDVVILELDYFSQKELIVEELLLKLISLMKERCNHIIGWYTIPNNKSYKKIILNNTLKELISNEEIIVLDLSYLYDEEYRHMCTFNNYYINDTGNIMIYKKIEETIRSITKWNI